MIKKFISVFVCVAMIATCFVGCGKKSSGTSSNSSSSATTAPTAAAAKSSSSASTGSTKKPGDIKLGYVCMNLGNPWFVEVKKGFEDACKKLGVHSMVIDSKYDVDKQVSDLESLVNDKYDGIMISPIDKNATKNGIDEANKAGIATCCIAQSQDNVDFRYIVNEYKYGQAIGTNAANWINANLKDKKVVKAAIISQDNVEDTKKRGDGVQDTVEKLCPNVKIVARQAGDTPEKGLKIIESVLAQNPDLNIVLATNDSGGIGGYQAMVNAGKTGKDPVAVFSGDATDEALNDMKKKDTIYRGTVDLVPYKSGYECAEKLYDMITKGIPSKQQTQYYNPLPVPLKDLLSGKYKK